MKNLKKLTTLLCAILICATMFTMVASAAHLAPQVSTNTYGAKNAVMVLQKMLNYKMRAGLTTDGWYGTKTKNAVIAFQKKAFPNESNEWDGICGQKTWKALFQSCTVRKGNKNNMVLVVQHILNKLYDNKKITLYSRLVEDGDFGSATLNAVDRFQEKYGLGRDGIVGPETWNELIYQYNLLTFDTAFSK